MHITKSVITSAFNRQLLIFFVTRMFVIIKNNYFCLLHLAYRHHLHYSLSHCSRICVYYLVIKNMPLFYVLF